MGDDQSMPQDTLEKLIDTGKLKASICNSDMASVSLSGKEYFFFLVHEGKDIEMTITVKERKRRKKKNSTKGEKRTALEPDF